ncbi:calcium/manganese antiporter SLC30A10 isoform X1 [Natator depressus]|uniref:calcium/manganese antiporter SLC30A10 isoform X1 n=1 Tax=Natator depressus TaxID=27790 RepID=UPI003EB75F9A
MGRYSGKTCRLIFMLVLTAGFFVAELVSGYLGNSIALVSDSFNMLSDLISLCVGIATGRIARRARRGPAATYGYGRAEAVGALSNAVFLTALCFTILVEAVLRLARPEPIDGPALVLIVGALGLAVNLVGLLIFQDWGSCCSRLQPRAAAPEPLQVVPGPGREEAAVVECQEAAEAGDSLNTQKRPEEQTVRKKEKKSEALNIRGVLLHVMGDALGSVVVVVAAAIFYALPLDANTPCNWQCYIDPSLTVVMVVIILSSAFPLIKETATVLLQMVPKGVNMQVLTERLTDVPGVSSLHEVHVWELAGGKNIATLHVKCQTTSDYQDASYKMREVFHEAGIHSVTIQPEYIDHKTSELICSSPCISKACASQLCCPQQEVELTHDNGYPEKNGLPATLHKDNSLNKNGVEIPIEYILAGDGIKNTDNCKKSDDKSYTHSTHF